MFHRDPLPLRQILEEVLRDSPLAKKLAYADVPRLWREVVGSPLDRYTIPVEVRDGCLIVHVTSPVWRMELELRKAQLLEQLNHRLNTPLQDLQILLAPPPEREDVHGKK